MKALNVPVESPIDRGGRSAGISSIVLLSLGVLQVVLGSTASKSVALTANGIDCIGDGFVSSVVWVGLRFLRRPADDKFHYGYFKVENLASVGAAIVMMVLAGYVILRSYTRLRNPVEVEAPIVGAMVALAAAIVAWALGIQKLRSGRGVSGSVKLEAFNTIKDGSASFLASMALIMASMGYLVADSIVGFVIAGIIITIGFAAIKESALVLADACDGLCMNRAMAIRAALDGVEGVLSVPVIRLRRTGPVFQGEMEVTVSPETTVAEFVRIRHQIETVVKDRFPEVVRLSITSALSGDE